MTQQEFLDFLHLAERLKTVTRHCYTAGGTHEVVAAHSWRLCLMAQLLAPEFPALDMNRVLRMCVVHDLGEAVTSDIPSFLKTADNEDTERRALLGITAMLPEPQRGEMAALFSEMEVLETEEARLYKALDKLEAVLQHNESDLSTWLPLEYSLNQTYADENVEEFPYLKALRELLRLQTQQKIEEGVS